MKRFMSWFSWVRTYWAMTYEQRREYRRIGRALDAVPHWRQEP
jgi:hypothetical protein